jgi:integration host factor subunit alpha
MELPSMTIIKDHIIGSLQRHSGFSRFESSRIVESVLETIKASLANGDDVLISGFGKFTVHQKVARHSRNPATGENLQLGPRRVITFKCSPVLRERVNGKGA